MSQPFRLATLVSALAAVVVVAFIAFRPALDPGASPVPSPSARPSSSAAPSRQSLPPTSEWLPFTSLFYGYTVRHPAGWTVIPAREHYGLPETSNLYLQFDKFDGGDQSLTAVGMRLRDGETTEDWLRAYFGDTIESGNACTPARSEWDSGTIDGQPALLVMALGPCGAAVDTFVFAGDRAYVFTAWGGLVDDRPLFETFLSTIRLEPASAVDPTPTP